MAPTLTHRLPPTTEWVRNHFYDMRKPDRGVIPDRFQFPPTKITASSVHPSGFPVFQDTLLPVEDQGLRVVLAHEYPSRVHGRQIVLGFLKDFYHRLPLLFSVMWEFQFKTFLA